MHRHGAQTANPDGGDAFEFYVRLHGDSKAQVLREMEREMIAGDRVALESAARSSVDLPAWVQKLLTEAGWKYYRKQARATGYAQDEDRP